MSRLLTKKNEATFGKKVNPPTSETLALSTGTKSEEVSPGGPTFGNRIFKRLFMKKVGADGLTDEERL